MPKRTGPVATRDAALWWCLDDHHAVPRLTWQRVNPSRFDSIRFGLASPELNQSKLLLFQSDRIRLNPTNPNPVHRQRRNSTL